MKPDQMIGNLVVRFPKLTLVFFLSLAIAAGFLLPRLEKDPSPYLLPPTHESRVNLKKLRAHYTGSNDGIIVLLESEKTIFNRATLSRIQKLSKAFEKIHLVTEKDKDNLAAFTSKLSPSIAQKVHALVQAPVSEETWMRVDDLKEAVEVSDEAESVPMHRLSTLLDSWEEKLSPIREVTSLSNTDNIIGKNGQLDVNPLFETVPVSKQELARIEKEAKANDLFKDILVTRDGKSTSIVLELSTRDNQTKAQYTLYNKVRHIVEKEIPGFEKHYIAGLPVVTGALGRVMEQDTKALFPIVILIVMACLFITFRKLKGIFIPLSVVIMSLLVTMGLEVLFNVPVNIITTTLPVFILSIGVADGIHMYSEYRDHRISGHEKAKAVQLTLEHLTIPVIMTSVTTAVAFYAISLTKIIQLHHFGIFVAAGAMVAMVYSLFFIPAVLMVLPDRVKDKKRTASKFETAYAGILVKLTKRFIRRPYLTFLAAGGVFVVSLIGASKVVVDNNNAGYFLKNSDIYISSQKLNHDAAGSSLINFLITDISGDTEPFKKARNLQYVEHLADFLEHQEDVGKVLGLTKLIKRINFALHDEQKAFDRIPIPSDEPNAQLSSKHLISQLLLLYENGGGDTLTDFTNTAYTQLNVPVILQTNSSRDIYRLTGKVKAFVGSQFPDHIKVDVTGSANVSVAATDEIVKGQLVSLLASLGIVLAMLFFTFRKVFYAGIAIVPLIMTISINFGIMGFFHIPLDIGTAIISSIVIGIGVDYAIHYLSRLKGGLNKGLPFSQALENTVRHSGKAIVSNAATVGLGFVALWFSVLTPLIIMGWMITVTMLVSAFCTLVLIPVLLIFVEKRSPAKMRDNQPGQLMLSAGKNKF